LSIIIIIIVNKVLDNFGLFFLCLVQIDIVEKNGANFLSAGEVRFESYVNSRALHDFKGETLKYRSCVVVKGFLWVVFYHMLFCSVLLDC